MRKTITKQDQQRINELLNSRRAKQIDKLIPKKELTKTQSIERLLQYEHDNTIGQCCNGLTYLEIEQLNNY